MKFTFGISTTTEPQRMEGGTTNHVREIIESIRLNNIPNDCYEIIVIGGDDNYQGDNDVTFINIKSIDIIQNSETVKSFQSLSN